MRRPAAALLGTVVGTVLLVSAKYGSASPTANSADSVAASDGSADGGASDTTGALPGDPSAGPVAPAGSPGAVPNTSPAPTGRTPSAGRSTPAPGRTAGAPPATTAAPACTTVSGTATRISSPGVGAVTVTIRVCGGVLKTSTGSQSRSNWDANAQALPALNTLAVKNYKTDISKIHYSGATLTSNAYQASLRSALAQAGT